MVYYKIKMELVESKKYINGDGQRQIGEIYQGWEGNKMGDLLFFLI